MPTPAPRSRRGRLAAGLLLAATALLALVGCSGDEDSSPGDPDLFCESAREAFTGSTEFDFGDPAQRQQVLDVLDRMVEYAPGEIKDEAEDTRDAVTEYAEQVSELAERQAAVDSSEGGEITTEDVEAIQDLVTELEQSDELQQAQNAIEPYLQETCAIDLGTATRSPGAATETTTAP